VQSTDIFVEYQFSPDQRCRAPKQSMITLSFEYDVYIMPESIYQRLVKYIPSFVFTSCHFDIYDIQITLIPFSLNLILKGNLSRKFTPISHNLITLFGVNRLLIELNKFLVFFHITNPSMMFWLVKNVITDVYDIAFRYRKSRTGILPFKFALT
jgi:hypothetical protein